MTHRQLVALRKRRDIEHERQEFLLGQINKNIVSFSMCRPKDYMPQITDFMPSRWGKEQSDDSDEATLVRLAQSIATPDAIAKGLVRIQ